MVAIGYNHILGVLQKQICQSSIVKTNLYDFPVVVVFYLHCHKRFICFYSKINYDFRKGGAGISLPYQIERHPFKFIAKKVEKKHGMYCNI